jgi:hypothetical protein
MHMHIHMHLDASVHKPSSVHAQLSLRMLQTGSTVNCGSTKGDQLGDHRVVERGDGVALGDARVDSDTVGLLRGLVAQQRASGGQVVAVTEDNRRTRKVTLMPKSPS